MMKRPALPATFLVLVHIVAARRQLRSTSETSCRRIFKLLAVVDSDSDLKNNGDDLKSAVDGASRLLEQLHGKDSSFPCRFQLDVANIVPLPSEIDFQPCNTAPALFMSASTHVMFKSTASLQKDAGDAANDTYDADEQVVDDQADSADDTYDAYAYDGQAEDTSMDDQATDGQAGDDPASARRCCTYRGTSCEALATACDYKTSSTCITGLEQTHVEAGGCFVWEESVQKCATTTVTHRTYHGSKLLSIRADEIDARDLMEQIALWSETSSSKADADADVVLVLTQRDLAGRNIGMTVQGAICSQPTRAVAVVQTGSLLVQVDLAVEIAHEIGHLIGMGHDAPQSQVKTSDDVSQSIMSANYSAPRDAAELDARRWYWSQDARAAAKTWIRDHRSCALGFDVQQRAAESSQALAVTAVLGVMIVSCLCAAFRVCARCSSKKKAARNHRAHEMHVLSSSIVDDDDVDTLIACSERQRKGNRKKARKDRVPTIDVMKVINLTLQEDESLPTARRGQSAEEQKTSGAAPRQGHRHSIRKPSAPKENDNDRRRPVIKKPTDANSRRPAIKKPTNAGANAHQDEQRHARRSETREERLARYKRLHQERRRQKTKKATAAAAIEATRSRDD